MSETRSNSKLGCFLVAGVVALLMMVGVVVLFWLVVRSLGQPTTRVARGSVLELRLAGSYTEGPAAFNLGPLFGGSPLSLWDLRRGLRAAAQDPDIVALRLDLGGSGVGWSSAEEILASLDRFRDTGKPVVALLGGDMISDTDYFLATAADRIWMNPETAAVINGVAAEVQFFRGTLEKLHIEPEVIMYKEYKSAGEPYLNYEMSEYMREAMTAVLDSIHESFLARVEQRRGLDRDTLVDFLARGMAPSGDVLELGLVDDLGYSDEVRASLAAVLGDTPGKDYRGISLSRYLASVRPERSSDGKIAIVFGEGPVVTAAPQGLFPFLSGGVLAGTTVARNLHEAAADPNVKAIVFRINSPGGSAVASDVVRRAIEKIREDGMPVVATLSDVAGSGGYWVAMEADAIVAHATTMTGSIGVVFTKFNLDGFFEWIGTHVERITTSPAADMFGLGPLDETELQGVYSWMDSTYASFVAKVAAARELELEYVEGIAKGRVWSGRDALEIGLVDRLGGLDEAVEMARELAGLEADDRIGLVVVPRQKTFFETLMEQSNRAGFARLTSWVSGATAPLSSSAEVQRWLRRMAQPQVQAVMPQVILD